MKISKEDVVELILNGKTNEELMQILNYSKYSSFKSFLRRNNIKIGELRGKTIEKKEFRDEIFKRNELFYYFAGLVASDGTLDTERPRIRIALKNSDCELLDNLGDRIFSNNKLHHWNSGKTDVCNISVENKEIYLALIELGITPQKTKTLDIDFNLIPENMIPHFIRGYFDGDGSIFYLNRDKVYNSSFCGGTSTMLKFQEILSANCISSRIYKDERKSFDFSNLKLFKNDSVKLGKFMYSNSTIEMKRKRDLFTMAFGGEE